MDRGVVFKMVGRYLEAFSVQEERVYSSMSLYLDLITRTIFADLGVFIDLGKFKKKRMERGI